MEHSVTSMIRDAVFQTSLCALFYEMSNRQKSGYVSEIEISKTNNLIIK